jgi:UPF0755 protein
MIKKIVFSILILALLVAAVVWFKFFTSKTSFAADKKYLYIHTNNATKQAVLDALQSDSMVSNLGDFEFVANRMDYWKKIKPGRYLIEKGDNIITIVRKLRNGDRWPVNLVINKLRLPQDLARLAGRNFETDSTDFTQYLDSNRLAEFEKIIPNTYSIPWTYGPEKIMNILNEEYDKWWNQKDRKQKAAALGYSPDKIYTVASIVEEETNRPDDKGNVASVYFNRLQKGMPLQADPTIRYALKDFKMNRIYYKHLAVASPYNTYLHTGLPPGPICTPSPATIDAVLNSPKTEYIYFVADADLRGGSTFTTNLTDHSKAARVYQDSLNAWLLRKAAKQKAIADSISKAAKP